MTIPIEADFLISYSSTEGIYSILTITIFNSLIQLRHQLWINYHRIRELSFTHGRFMVYTKSYWMLGKIQSTGANSGKCYVNKNCVQWEFHFLSFSIHILQILTLVTKKVCKLTLFVEKHKEGKHQVPCFVSRLTGFFYFYGKKFIVIPEKTEPKTPKVIFSRIAYFTDVSKFICKSSNCEGSCIFSGVKNARHNMLDFTSTYTRNLQ